MTGGMNFTDATAFLHSLWELNKGTKLRAALRVWFKAYERVERERDEAREKAIKLDAALTTKTAMANELTHMHAELSVVHGNSSAEHAKHIATFQKGIREIAEIVWDTSAKSSDRIRRLQEQCIPREYLDALKDGGS